MRRHTHNPGGYSPSEEEIAAATDAMKATWSAAERMRRAGKSEKPVETPVVELELADKPWVETGELEMP